MITTKEKFEAIGWVIKKTVNLRKTDITMGKWKKQKDKQSRSSNTNAAKNCDAVPVPKVIPVVLFLLQNSDISRRRPSADSDYDKLNISVDIYSVN